MLKTAECDGTLWTMLFQLRFILQVGFQTKIPNRTDGRIKLKEQIISDQFKWNSWKT